MKNMIKLASVPLMLSLSVVVLSGSKCGTTYVQAPEGMVEASVAAAKAADKQKTDSDQQSTSGNVAEAQSPFRALKWAANIQSANSVRGMGWSAVTSAWGRQWPPVPSVIDILGGVHVATQVGAFALPQYSEQFKFAEQLTTVPLGIFGIGSLVHGVASGIVGAVDKVVGFGELLALADTYITGGVITSVAPYAAILGAVYGSYKLYQHVNAAPEVGWDVDTLVDFMGGNPPKNGIKEVTVERDGQRVTQIEATWTNSMGNSTIVTVEGDKVVKVEQRSAA